MPRLSANLSFLFNEVPFLDRFREAARAGFRAVEFAFAYDVPEHAIAARLAEHGLECVLINAPPGDYAAGERGLAAMPGREDEFAASFATALRYARGAALPAHSCDGRRRCRLAPMPVCAARTLDLRRQSAQRVRRGATSRHQRADRGAQPARRAELSLLDGVRRARHPRRGRRAQPQSADGPLSHAGGRGRSSRSSSSAGCRTSVTSRSRARRDGTSPTSARSTTRGCLRRIDALGYDGWVGCEYRPLHGTVEGLAWRDRLLG